MFSVSRVVIYIALLRKTLPPWPVAFALIFFKTVFMTIKHLNLTAFSSEMNAEVEEVTHWRLSQYARYSQKKKKSTKYRLLLAVTALCCPKP